MTYPGPTPPPLPRPDDTGRIVYEAAARGSSEWPRRTVLQVVASVLTAGVIGGLATLGGAYLAQRDTARDVAELRREAEQTHAVLERETAAWHEHHLEGGHPDVVEALHRIDVRLERIEARLDRAEDDRRGTRRR